MGTEAKAKNRYYVNERFSKDVLPEIKEAVRIIEDNLFFLRDKTWDVREFFLTSSRGMNIETQVGKPLLVVLIQDQVGGWVVSWPAKFQDSANLNLDLSANTYSTILWQPVSDTRVLAIGGITGGLLA